MKFTKLKTDTVLHVNVSRYLIEWKPNREVSKPQALVKQFLHRYWKTHVVLEEFVIPGSRLRIDLLNLTRRIVVEVSPESSHSFSAFFHKTRNAFGAAVRRDLDKQAWAERNGFAYIDLTTDDIANLSPKLFEERGITL